MTQCLLNEDVAWKDIINLHSVVVPETESGSYISDEPTEMSEEIIH
ncbi:hypothetical protein [Tetragenococcus halophilus]|nr:hypothetical protein [Tetragenococcus halophilus]